MSTSPDSSARRDTAEIRDELGHGLRTRHLTMMGLGSAVGAGLFLGTGVGIRAAGPAVLISYLVAGIVVVFVMRMLGELAAARPASGTFATYARQAFGGWAGFSLGWLYWFMLIMVMGTEITGAGAIMGSWFGVDGWIPGLVCVVLFTVVNLFAVRGFGEFEYWFSFVKVAVIIFFLVIGVLLIFGWLPGHEAVGTDNFTPFAPEGISGISAGLLAVAFAFGGIEIVTIAAAESDQPRQAITAAVHAVVWRILVFYLGSVLVITALLDRSTLDQAEGAADSPFTRVLSMADVPAIVGIMEIVIVLALLSAFNAQIYGTSRLMYSFAWQGNAPKIFRKISGQRVPVAAVTCSLVFAFISVGLQLWGPDDLITLLFNAVGGCLLVIWVMIVLSELKLRPEMEQEGSLTLRIWWWPVLPVATLVALTGLTVLMLFDASARDQVYTVAVGFGLLAALGFWVTRHHSDQETDILRDRSAEAAVQ
ncbi:amino acid permease [Corynebacterium terpenotabidum]|uniref:Aromatic amino acid transport protein n=1 Tax=Corynebacterium terpenotabidum Y-11 TaxID=1200352 RepID=S4XKQ4_9CORY|nr:amino acid permease [Corynebacterium terpenotabidum]AGP31168.1 aromatic amino acid transport protein [Corynebacterium terpenotabidum Y-11]